MEKSENNSLTINVPENSQTGQGTAGSPSQVKPEESAKPETSSPKKSLWKTAKIATIPGDSNETEAESDPKTTSKSVAKRVNQQIKAMTLIKRWTQMTSHSQFANDKDHLQYMRDTAKDAIVAIPDPLIADTREEVLAILLDIIKQYKMELGANHPLTLELQTKIQTLREEMMTSAREQKRDTKFFRRLSTVFHE